MVGATVPDKTLLRKGTKLAKAREESLQNTLGETAAKRKGRKPEFAFGRLVSTNPTVRKTKIPPSSAAASKEGIARTPHMDSKSKRPMRVGPHVPPPPKLSPRKNRLGPTGEVLPKL